MSELTNGSESQEAAYRRRRREEIESGGVREITIEEVVDPLVVPDSFADLDVDIVVVVEFGADGRGLETLKPAELMKLRGTLLAVGDLMKGSMIDLATSIRTSGDERMRAMVALYALGGGMTVDGLVEAVDDFLRALAMPVVSLHEVESSNLAALGWSGDAAVVEFTNGGLYAYEGVSSDLFQEWWEAPSRGTFLSQRIKGQFGFTKLVG